MLNLFLSAPLFLGTDSTAISVILQVTQNLFEYFCLLYFYFSLKSAKENLLLCQTLRTPKTGLLKQDKKISEIPIG